MSKNAKFMNVEAQISHELFFWSIKLSSKCTYIGGRQSKIKWSIFEHPLSSNEYKAYRDNYPQWMLKWGSSILGLLSAKHYTLNLLKYGLF